MANALDTQNALLREALSEISKMTLRQDGFEKTLGRMNKSAGDQASALKSLLSAGGGSGAPVGGMNWDGCDELGLLRYIGGDQSRTKSLGCGSFLTQIANEASFLEPKCNVREYTGFSGDRGAVHKSLEAMRSRLVRKTALAEGSGVTGGYTVPVQFYADLLRLVAEDSFVRKMCTVMPMQARDLYVPALTQSAAPAAGTSAFFGGLAASWQPEAATINESEPSFRQIHLIARDLMFYTVASNQLLQDNAVALDTLLTTLFKEGMSWFYDYFILRGNGADQPLGILNASSTYGQTKNTASHFYIQDVANMMSHFLMSSWKNGVWMMHPSVLQDLMIMQDPALSGSGGVLTGRLVWVNQNGGMADPMPVKLLGMPIYFTEKLPQLGTTGCVLLVDASKIIVGDRMAIQIEASPWPKFLTNQMVWRIISRWDSQPWLDNPVILADGAQNYKVSPQVMWHS